MPVRHSLNRLSGLSNRSQTRLLVGSHHRTGGKWNNSTCPALPALGLSLMAVHTLIHDLQGNRKGTVFKLTGVRLVKTELTLSQSLLRVKYKDKPLKAKSASPSYRKAETYPEQHQAWGSQWTHHLPRDSTYACKLQSSTSTCKKVLVRSVNIFRSGGRAG